MKKFLALVFVFLLMMASSCAFAMTIPTGYVGIKTTFGTISSDLLLPGWHWTAPWDSVTKLDTRWQKYEVSTSSFSRDIQQVDVQMSFSYALNVDGAMTMFKNVGVDYADKIMMPIALDALKSTFAKYSAEQLISTRDKISFEVETAIADNLFGYYISIKNVAITDIDFTDSFTDAIEAKQVATQNKLKTETEQEQQTIIAQAEAEREKIKAEAEAERILISAKADADAKRIAADAEAYRIKMEAENVTDMTIRKTIAEQWDGKLPTFTSNTDGLMIDVSDIMGE